MVALFTLTLEFLPIVGEVYWVCTQIWPVRKYSATHVTFYGALHEIYRGKHLHNFKIDLLQISFLYVK